ncbi:hypothetical protein [Frankia gtarii]|uniref:hypothetical protein n=1 Tax=Frankia gtarii TaxID=2950102 RepID=UPI0021C04153|nr:hypothetical protein [Frankia gtarii]
MVTGPGPRWSAFHADDPVPELLTLARGEEEEQARRLLLDGADLTGPVLDLGGDGALSAALHERGGTVHARSEALGVLSEQEGYFGAVVGAEVLHTVAVAEVMRACARILVPGGTLRLLQSDPVRAIPTPPLVFADTWDGPKVGNVARPAGRLSAELEGTVIWEARRAGLLPSRIAFGFSYLTVSAGEVDTYLHRPPAAGLLTPYDRIRVPLGDEIAGRYAQAWRDTAADGPVTVCTPLVFLDAVNIADPVPPRPPADETDADYQDLFDREHNEKMTEPHSRAAWRIIFELDKFHRREEGLQSGWAAPFERPAPGLRPHQPRALHRLHVGGPAAGPADGA